jgi:hypothetical protein
MVRFRCPECGEETELEAQLGCEIVSVYCLNHTGGADAHLRPVHMTMEHVTVLTEPEWTRVAA